MVDDPNPSRRLGPDYVERLRQYELGKKNEEEQLERRAEEVRNRYGNELALMIERCGIYDEGTAAIAVGYLTKNIAARIGTLDSRELSALARLSVSQAYKFEDFQREQLQREATQQLDQRQGELKRDTRQRYYADLRETHRIVEERLESDRTRLLEESARDDRTDQRSFRSRYADLGTTHQQLDVELRQRDESTARQTADVERATQGEAGRSSANQTGPMREQSDNKRAIDDRTLTRQTRLRELGHGIEDGFHDELDQGNGRDRGR